MTTYCKDIPFQAGGNTVNVYFNGHAYNMNYNGKYAIKGSFTEDKAKNYPINISLNTNGNVRPTKDQMFLNFTAVPYSNIL